MIFHIFAILLVPLVSLGVIIMFMAPFVGTFALGYLIKEKVKEKLKEIEISHIKE